MDEVSDVKLRGPEVEDTTEDTGVSDDKIEETVEDAVMVPGKVGVAMQLHALEILLALHP